MIPTSTKILFNNAKPIRKLNKKKLYILNIDRSTRVHTRRQLSSNIQFLHPTLRVVFKMSLFGRSDTSGPSSLGSMIEKPISTFYFEALPNQHQTDIIHYFSFLFLITANSIYIEYLKIKRKIEIYNSLGFYLHIKISELYSIVGLISFWNYNNSSLANQ